MFSAGLQGRVRESRSASVDRDASDVRFSVFERDSCRLGNMIDDPQGHRHDFGTYSISWQNGKFDRLHRARSMRHPHTGNKGKIDLPGWEIAVASKLQLEPS